MHSISQHECNENAQNKKSVKAFQATKEQPSRTIVHAKLEMTTPDSPEEVEADAAANDIVQGGKIARSIFAGSAGGGISVSSQMEGRLNSMQGGGQVMPDGLRNMMERGFNRDFSQVRLHTDSEAASLSSSIHAKAFTHGNDIYFNQGQFSPNTSEGQKLMAHELTHVAQGGGKVGRNTIFSDGLSYEHRTSSSKTNSTALILYGQGGIHIGKAYKHDVGKAYELSAKAQQKKINENADFQNTNIITAYVPNKTSFFDQIQNVDDNSLCYLSVYSHGMGNQIVLGGCYEAYKDSDGNTMCVSESDVDIHIEDLRVHQELLKRKFQHNAIIELWGCNQGNDAYYYEDTDTCIAQELANIIGKNVKVYAFNTGTRFKKNNKPGKHKHMYDGETIPSKEGGKRIEFSPID